jgi:hypothetical protein
MTERPFDGPRMVLSVVVTAGLGVAVAALHRQT